MKRPPSALARTSEQTNLNKLHKMALSMKKDFLAQLACDEKDDCPICYEPLADPVTTACKHKFCIACLLGWLEIANTCPSCRRELYANSIEERDASVRVVEEAQERRNAELRLIRIGVEAEERRIAEARRVTNARRDAETPRSIIRRLNAAAERD